jgi:hypothetical protein
LDTRQALASQLEADMEQRNCALPERWTKVYLPNVVKERETWFEEPKVAEAVAQDVTMAPQA